MLEFLSGLLIGIGNLLGTLLPDSNIQEYITTAPEVVQNGMRWLNWVFPVAQCLVFLSAELALVIAYVGVRWVMSKSISITEKMVG